VGSFGGPVVDQMLGIVGKRARFDLRFWNKFFNIVAFVMSGAIGAAMALCFTSSRELEIVAASLRRLDRLVIVGAIVLSAGVLEIGSLLAWPTAPVASIDELTKTTTIAKQIHDINSTVQFADADAGKLAYEHAVAVEPLRRQAEASTIAAGIGFTTLLLTFYLPNSMMLHGRARDIVKDKDFKEQEEELAKAGIGTSGMDKLWGGAAAGAPILIAILSKLTGLFGHVPDSVSWRNPSTEVSVNLGQIRLLLKKGMGDLPRLSMPPFRPKVLYHYTSAEGLLQYTPIMWHNRNRLEAR
jgi:hypothetical protein